MHLAHTPELLLSSAITMPRCGAPTWRTNIRANHRASWRRGRRTSATLHNSIAMDVELSMGTPQALAYTLFGQLVKARVDYAATQGMVAFLDELTADEEIFGLGYSFGCSYRLLTNLAAFMDGTANPTIPDNLFDISRTGIWRSVGTDWNLWRSSLSNVFDNRGLAGLTVPAENDVIVDLCDSGLTVPNSSPRPSTTQFYGLQSPAFKNKQPPPRQSYLNYKQRVAIQSDKYISRQKPLQPGSRPNTPGDMLAPSGMSFSSSPSSVISSGQQPIGQQPASDVLQESGPGSYRAIYIGTSERAGYEIPRPNIQSVGGQTPVEEESTFIMEQTGVTFGVPVFRADWYIVYSLPSAPSQVSGPPKLQA